MTNLILIASVSAYCHCAKCCGKANQPTASGLMPEPECTVAGPTNLPFGTWVKIQSIGWRRVEDRMAEEYRAKPYFDIYMRSHKKAIAFGRKTLIVEAELNNHCVKR